MTSILVKLNTGEQFRFNGVLTLVVDATNVTITDGSGPTVYLRADVLKLIFS